MRIPEPRTSGTQYLVLRLSLANMAKSSDTRKDRGFRGSFPSITGRLKTERN